MQGSGRLIPACTRLMYAARSLVGWCLHVGLSLACGLVILSPLHFKFAISMRVPSTCANIGKSEMQRTALTEAELRRRERPLQRPTPPVGGGNTVSDCHGLIGAKLMLLHELQRYTAWSRETVLPYLGLLRTSLRASSIALSCSGWTTQGTPGTTPKPHRRFASLSFSRLPSLGLPPSLSLSLYLPCHCPSRSRSLSSSSLSLWAEVSESTATHAASVD